MLEATEFARAQGHLLSFHQIVFHKFYGEVQDISHWEVLKAAADKAGLEPEAMQCAVETGSYKQLVEKECIQAYALGITGVPAYIINWRYAMIGAQAFEVFQQAFENLGIIPSK